MASVTLKDLVKEYEGGVRVVDRINLSIKDREFVVLVGPSGCGKSTTLRMIAGLEEISAGTIAIGGKVVNHLQPKDRDIACATTWRSGCATAACPLTRSRLRSAVPR